MEFEIVEMLSEKYPVTFLCKLMNVNRSGYYKWRLRKGKLNQYQKNRRDLTLLLHEEHVRHPSYGYHRLAASVRKNTGWIFSDNLAHKCCKTANITSKARKRKYRKPGEEHMVFPNTIRGHWNASDRLEIVVSDMTILNHRGKAYEWTYMVDVFDNSIITSHSSSRPGDIRPYYACLNDLKKMKKEKATPTVLHTDQGAVYSSARFNLDLEKYSIQRSMSRAGTPTDNPIIESINGWLKDEIALDFDIDSYERFEDFLVDLVDYYNNERPAYCLGYLSPAEYRRQQAKKKSFQSG